MLKKLLTIILICILCLPSTLFSNLQEPAYAASNFSAFIGKFVVLLTDMPTSTSTTSYSADQRWIRKTSTDALEYPSGSGSTSYNLTLYNHTGWGAVGGDYTNTSGTWQRNLSYVLFVHDASTAYIALSQNLYYEYYWEKLVGIPTLYPHWTVSGTGSFSDPYIVLMSDESSTPTPVPTYNGTGYYYIAPSASYTAPTSVYTSSGITLSSSYYDFSGALVGSNTTCYGAFVNRGGTGYQLGYMKSKMGGQVYGLVVMNPWEGQAYFINSTPTINLASSTCTGGAGTLSNPWALYSPPTPSPSPSLPTEDTSAFSTLQGYAVMANPSTSYSTGESAYSVTGYDYSPIAYSAWMGFPPDIPYYFANPIHLIFPLSSDSRDRYLVFLRNGVPYLMGSTTTDMSSFSPAQALHTMIPAWGRIHNSWFTVIDGNGSSASPYLLARRNSSTVTPASTPAIEVPLPTAPVFTQRPGYFVINNSYVYLSRYWQTVYLADSSSTAYVGLGALTTELWNKATSRGFWENYEAKLGAAGGNGSNLHYVDADQKWHDVTLKTSTITNAVSPEDFVTIGSGSTATPGTYRVIYGSGAITDPWVITNAANSYVNFATTTVDGSSAYTPLLPSTTTTVGDFPEAYVSLFLLIMMPVFEISPQTPHTQKPHDSVCLPVGYFCVFFA
jgi:hypothetical protein